MKIYIIYLLYLHVKHEGIETRNLNGDLQSLKKRNDGGAK